MMRLKRFLRSNKLTARLLGFISGNPIYRGALVIGSGTVLAQLIGILTLPIITRIYDPTEMGILAVYSSILSIITLTATLRYDFSYILPEKEETATNIFALCIILLVLTSIVFSLVVLFAGDLLVNFLGLDSLGQYYWLLIPGFIGAGLYSILNHWAIRKRDYRRITYTKINQSTGGALSKIVLGLLSFGPIGLILGHIVSQVAGIGTLGKAMWKSERKNLRHVSPSGIESAAREYWTFPVFNLPASLVNVLSFQLPTLFLMVIYDSHVVGLYALMSSLLVLPLSLISTSIGQAFLGEVSKMVRERSSGLREVYLKTIKHLTFIALPTIGALTIASPSLVPFVFGSEWADAGILAIPLAILVIPQFIVSPTTRLEIYGYNHWNLAWDVARVCGVIAGFYLSWSFELSIPHTLMIYSAIMLIMYIINIFLNLRAICSITYDGGETRD